MADPLIMFPPPGSRQRCLVGDLLEIRVADPRAAEPGRRAILRTTIGGAEGQRIAAWLPITAATEPGDGGWRDVPMQRDGDGWVIRMRLNEVGCFGFKARVVAADGDHHWAPGSDAQISVHPRWTRSGNTIYCAFVRQFGDRRTQATTLIPLLDEQMRVFEQHGYAVLPPSGTLRDLARHCDHIFTRLGCRILHLLPINPTPTTYARFGRFGSPYAALDFTAIDPALVEFDRHHTAVDQFRELTRAVHRHHGRLILDLAINHTGWGSRLQDAHPDWFLRDPDGRFQSPGAWGTVWEDLVELDHGQPALWARLAEAFLTWCERGVDGFRCDAGYMVPLRAWQAITARVHDRFPDTVFLLEGLGGAWQTTADLLATGGMQWTYSELFQNHSSAEVHVYLRHCLAQEGTGLLVHYSETHDNDRLAARGRRWSLMRNRLCALCSVQGGFGFTAGVEWLATEKIRVHQANGLNWAATGHIMPELATLNRLLADHPCFDVGARLRLRSAPGAELLVLEREAAGERLLVCANLDLEHGLSWSDPLLAEFATQPVDLLDERSLSGPAIPFAPGQVRCLSPRPWRPDGSGLRRRASDAVWDQLMRAVRRHFRPEELAALDQEATTAAFIADPEATLAALLRCPAGELGRLAELPDPAADYFPVVGWDHRQASRVTLVPPDHAVIIRSDRPFRATLALDQDTERVSSAPIADGHAAVLPPLERFGDAQLSLDHFDDRPAAGALRFLQAQAARPGTAHGSTMLLTNGRGAMCRLPARLDAISSKYDAVLAANLHPRLPVDRQVLVKSLHAWLRIDGIGTPLAGDAVQARRLGDKAVFDLLLPIGGGDRIALRFEALLCPGRNTVLLAWELLEPWQDPRPLQLVVRLALEDRSFHGETVHNHLLAGVYAQSIAHREHGFVFAPSPSHRLTAHCPSARWRAQEEWWHDIPHPHEGQRGQRDRGDAWSPGWFSMDLAAQPRQVLCLDAETDPPADPEALLAAASVAAPHDLDEALDRACQAYLVRRDDWTSVIAGYPWFLDWGRDTLICARGLLAAGRLDEVLAILAIFGRFVDRGTLPNSIHGADASNRDTSDAPLWYAVVVEELAQAHGEERLAHRVDEGRDLIDICLAIARGYRDGTPNGIHMDPSSGLIWSPAHFTWMDTNHPACTPRLGYPIEIQALWWRLLRLLAARGAAGDARIDSQWAQLAEQVGTAITRYYRGPHWLADNLAAATPAPVTRAARDDALRPNALIAITLGAVPLDLARATVRAALRHLVVPGAIRSLAPLPVDLPLPIRDAAGRLIGDPRAPYRGRYAGDEDSQRKPAYHNGTAWVWPFPMLCEAIRLCWPDDPFAAAAARAYLGSVDRLLDEGCIGHLPEICDGDAPHAQRGCDAQAWSVTEALRVLRLL